jgi:hypothetical protein
LQASTCIPCTIENGECLGAGDTSCCPGLYCEFGTLYSCQPVCPLEGMACNPSPNNCCTGLSCNPDGSGGHVCGSSQYCIEGGSQGECSLDTDCCASSNPWLASVCYGSACTYCNNGFSGSCLPGPPGSSGSCCSGFFCSGAYQGCTQCLGPNDICSGAQNGPCCGGLTCKSETTGRCEGASQCIPQGGWCPEGTCCSGLVCNQYYLQTCMQCGGAGASCSVPGDCCTESCDIENHVCN